MLYSDALLKAVQSATGLNTLSSKKPIAEPFGKSLCGVQ